MANNKPKPKPKPKDLNSPAVRATYATPPPAKPLSAQDKANQKAQAAAALAKQRQDEANQQAAQAALAPIGVKKGSVAPTPGVTPEQKIAGYYGKVPGVPAKYFDGMETGEGVPGFPQDTAGIALLQKSLTQAYPSILKAGGYSPGQMDTATTKAYAQLLADSNISGKDWQSTLTDRLSAAAKGELLATTKRNPLVIKLSSPEDIQAAAQNATKTLHNTYMTPQELANFTAAYQQSEAQFQTKSYDATGFDPLSGQQDTSGSQVDAQGNPVTPAAGQGTTLTAPPTGAALSQAITNKTIAEHPNEFAANTFTDRLNEILGGLKSPFSNAGQVGPL